MDAHRDRVGVLEQTVGKRGFPVIDVGDDAEIAGVGGQASVQAAVSDR
jgi:hypothetical protein